MAGLVGRRMLSKAEEEGSDEVEVRREDQDKINKFSRLHQRELALQEQLEVKSVRWPVPFVLKWKLLLTSARKQKEKEELDDLTTELELADEDEKIQYRVGDSFFHLPLEQAQQMLETATTRSEEESSELEEKLGSVRDEMKQLKVELYARFGKQINLET
ncbi:hypothetical protein ACO1O0_006218 [Amphichorda felina]